MIKQIIFNHGFLLAGITHVDNNRAKQNFNRWLNLKNEGEMSYMRRHGLKRTNASLVEPKAVSIISVGLNYLPFKIDKQIKELYQKDNAVVSVYAQHKDYHKLMRKRLMKLSNEIESIYSEPISCRAFVDSAPLLEKALAESAGLGFYGKHTNIINRDHGSFFFLGELAIDRHLPKTRVTTSHCGSCRRCIDVCPTKAIVAPYQLDVKRCISYLTIEHKGIIDDSLKPLIGNRIYGCDDCQLFCPWNRYAKVTKEVAFLPSGLFLKQKLFDFLNWDELIFLKKTEGSPIRRIGYAQFIRNVAIAAGNYLKEVKDNGLITLIFNQKIDNEAAIDALNWAKKQVNCNSNDTFK